MSFQCLECGHRGKQALQGACPACGSHRLQGQKRAELARTEKGQRPSLAKKLVVVALWLCLAYVLYQKLLGNT